MASNRGACAASIRVMVLSLGAAASASANLIITPSFDTSITGDSNAAQIESVIYSTIAIYQSKFTDPINVVVQFQSMSTGLGQNSATYYQLPYKTFINALTADATSANDAIALSHLPAGTTNPVTGSTSIAINTANIRALGISGSFAPIGGFDGVIGLNTHLTDIGSSDTTGQYSLQAVIEHELDEVLGLGSDVGGTGVFANPRPEDLFRYDASGARSFTSDTSKRAFFSINSTTDLAEFNNQTASGDWGDWRSNPLQPGVQPEVQDAFATPGAHPVLGVELTALDVVGYNLATPEPGTVLLSGAALLIFGGMLRRRARRIV